MNQDATAAFLGSLTNAEVEQLRLALAQRAARVVSAEPERAFPGFTAVSVLASLCELELVRRRAEQGAPRFVGFGA